ncbi:MAG: hypothetical protein ACNYZI_09715, partial [Anaerolineales bacterium]
RQLMAQAGYPDGQGFLTLGIVWYRAGHIKPLVAQWVANLNIEVEIEIADWENVIRTYRNRNIFYMGWSSDYPDPDAYLRVSIRTNFQYWQNETYDQLLAEAQRTLDQSDRIPLYQEADKILIEEAVIMPITYSRTHLLCKPWVKLPTQGVGRKFKDIILKPH